MDLTAAGIPSWRVHEWHLKMNRGEGKNHVTQTAGVLIRSLVEPLQRGLERRGREIY